MACTIKNNSIAYDRSIHLEQLKKARNTDVGSAGLAASHINNRAFEDNVTQPNTVVKNESAEVMDITVDADTESPVPAVQFSERTWTESDYVQEREKAAKDLSTPCITDSSALPEGIPRFFWWIRSPAFPGWCGYHAYWGRWTRSPDRAAFR